MKKLKDFLNNWNPLYFNLTLHALFIYSFTFMTWQQMLWAFAMAWLLSGLGNMMLHRYYSHKTFEIPRITELLLLPLTVILAHTNGPIAYASLHRQHHKLTDTERDVHCPHYRGRFTVLAGLWEMYPMSTFAKYRVPVAKDLARDPVLMFLHTHYHKIWLASFIVVGLLVSWHAAVILFSWPAMFLKILANLIINGACHPTPGVVKDFPEYSFLTFGEAMHKYHHDNPNDPYFSRSFWTEPSMTVIKLIQKRPTSD